MAWTAPRTWATSELVTASMMNTHVRDNLSALWVGTTAGDMDYYTAATTKDRIPIGTAGYGLFSTGSIPEWSGGIKVIHNNTSDTVKQSSDAGNEIYTFTIPANTLGTNGMIGVCGWINVTASTSDATPFSYVTYGSSNTSDGVLISSVIGTFDPGESANAWFDVKIIAKGASSERITGIYIQSRTTTMAVSGENIAIDQTASQELRILNSSLSATSDSIAFTVRNLMIYTVPYLVTT
jgi:hypothetical protein